MEHRSCRPSIHDQAALEEPGLSRRGLFVAGAASTSALAASGALATAAAARGVGGETLPLIGGTIERIVSAQRLTLRQGQELTEVRLLPGAEVWREGRASLGDFSVGERVSAEGKRGPDGTFDASRLQTLFDFFEATVDTRDGDVLRADKRRIRLTGSTEARVGEVSGRRARATPLDQLGAGDRIVVRSRFDPATQTYVATIIGELT